MESKGLKYDEGKTPMALVPPIAEEELAKAFGFGAKKYSEWQWTDGIKLMRIMSACKRHINAWIRGEEVASDSGVHHLGHAMACLAMIIDTQILHPDLDDRPKCYALDRINKALDKSTSLYLNASDDMKNYYEHINKYGENLDD